MNNFEDNNQKVPPSYEAAIGSNTNASGPFPPFPQPPSNPSYIPQTDTKSTMYPNPQAVIVGAPDSGRYATCPNVMYCRIILIAFIIFMILSAFAFVIVCAVILKWHDSTFALFDRMLSKRLQ
ncbi:unnamed protein product [Cercopithifilaria johnstoni]|uniref:Uncharacterized protein n=1 Tax=Cercopithifilaria johnstoni TaxID=2874296 RepID=A0A8J2MFR6_9BILA|nr:unnamed protein product [Cercopithifilaria johnstoni]